MSIRRMRWFDNNTETFISCDIIPQESYYTLCIYGSNGTYTVKYLLDKRSRALKEYFNEYIASIYRRLENGCIRVRYYGDYYNHPPIQRGYYYEQ